MADQWYFAWEDQKFGPFSTARLKELAALGRLQPMDTVWKQGVERGLPAAQVKNLFPAPEVPDLPVQGGAAAPAVSSAMLPYVCVSAPLAEGTPDGEPGHIIPDGLTLAEIPVRQTVAVAAPTSSPTSGATEGRTPESPAGMIGAVGLRPNDVAIPKRDQAGSWQKRVRKGQVTRIRGAVLVSQDGENVRYRRKCLKCGYEDACRSTMPIKNGLSTERFSCRKCGKPGEVVIEGTR